MFGRYEEVYSTYSLAEKDCVCSALQAQGIQSRIKVRSADSPMRAGGRTRVPFEPAINEAYRYRYSVLVPRADAEKAAYVLRSLGK